jgi:hypothetical protein
MMSAAENVLYCSNDTSACNSFARRSLLKAPKVVVARRLMQQSLVEREAWLLLLACVNGLAPQVIHGLRP